MSNQRFIKGFNAGMQAGYQSTISKSKDTQREIIDDELTSITKSVNALKPKGSETPSKEYVLAKRRQIELMAQKDPEVFGSQKIKTADEVASLYDGLPARVDDPTTQGDETRAATVGVKDLSSGIQGAKVEMETSIANIKAKKAANIASAKADISAKKVPVEIATKNVKDSLDYEAVLNSTWTTLRSTLTDAEKKALDEGALASSITNLDERLKKVLQKTGQMSKVSEAILMYSGDTVYNKDTGRFESASLTKDINQYKQDYSTLTGVDISNLSEFNDKDQSLAFYREQYKLAGVDISDIPLNEEYTVVDEAGLEQSVTFSPNAWDDMDEQIIEQYVAGISTDMAKASYTKKVTQLKKDLENLLGSIYYK
tara:strand:+ start:189 stop:1298 length:1110 start_codon:yes stop_codon:yes gene_type:complete